MNLFKLADKNSKLLEEKLNSIKLTDQYRENSEIYNDFINFVRKNWTISINTKLRDFSIFLISGMYKNIYMVKIQEKKMLEKHFMTKISLMGAVKTHLKKFKNSRLEFDKFFEDGEKFKYGSLNIGGLGMNNYGEFCIIFERNIIESFKTLAFLKEDSLNYFKNNKLNIDRLREEIANKKNCHILASIKHQDDICKISREEWDQMICYNNCYIEAITKDEVLVEHIKVIRINKEDYYYYFELLFESNTVGLDEFEKHQLSIFLGIFELLEKHNIEWELV